MHFIQFIRKDKIILLTTNNHNDQDKITLFINHKQKPEVKPGFNAEKHEGTAERDSLIRAERFSRAIEKGSLSAV